MFYIISDGLFFEKLFYIMNILYLDGGYIGDFCMFEVFYEMNSRNVWLVFSVRKDFKDF